MPDGASTVTSTTPGESDTTRITTEVLATYFVVAAVILGSLLFIGVRKLAQLCCFSNIFNRPNTDAEDKTYNPHTPVPGLLYQLQMAYDKNHGSSSVRPVSRAGSQSSLLQRASQTAESVRSSNRTYRSNRRSSNFDKRASTASDVTMPGDNVHTESAPVHIQNAPSHYENLPVEVAVDVITPDTTSVADSDIQPSGTSVSTAEDRPEIESLNDCGAICSSDNANPGGASSRRYKKNTTAAGRPVSRGIPLKVRGSLENS
ncbi:hypothetical protein LSAT2_003797 [Lamellibrachia satsuma]|nr:hypothetical protein LSAT2_003797 [Lamellibrachia satsuma]